MKTSAFLVRAGICFLLSLIPVTELENRIYSARMELRGRWGSAPNLVIVDSDFGGFFVTSRLQSLGAALVVNANQDRSNDLILDSDGVVRKAILLPKGMSSLAYQAYVRLGLDPGKLRKPREPHLINYLGPAESFARCPLSHLEICGDLEGKIVILNDTGDEGMVLRTPLGEMSRVEVLANELNTVVNHHPIYQTSFIEKALLILAMTLVAAFYILYYPVVISAIAITGTGVAIIVILFQAIFHLFDIYIPSANLAGALLITYLVFTGYRLAFQENLQWRNLKQQQYLREMDQMKTNFLSIVSHDLKTPVAKIQAIAERLRRELALPAEQRSDWRELIDSIENSNNELRHYITSILNLSKIESQKVILNKKSNDINRLIEQALKRLRSFAQQKNIAVEESLDPLFSIECDEDLMRQVLTNLIDNAIKYSPQNSKIIVRSREEEGFVRVEVEDFGPGIPKNQLPLMFRKFNRFLRPIKEQVKGSGLGLYLSKYFIELHGGTIRVESVEGKGTKFSFTLPLHGVESEAILG